MSSKRPVKKKRKSIGKYRSGLEKKFADALPSKFMDYEPYDVPYTTFRNYKPDFVYKDIVLIECKGFFRVGDTQKYKAIRDMMNAADTEASQYAELIFVLSNPHTKVRKGGKITMGQWCVKEGFKHYTLDNTDELIDYVTDIY
jgi:hypothetical protein